MVMATRSQASGSGSGSGRGAGPSQNLSRRPKDRTNGALSDPDDDDGDNDGKDNDDDSDSQNESIPFFALCHFTESEIDFLERKLNMLEDNEDEDVAKSAHVVPYSSSPSSSTEEQATQAEMEQRLIQVYRQYQAYDTDTLFYVDRLSLRRIPGRFSDEMLRVLSGSSSLLSLPDTARNELNSMPTSGESGSGWRGVYSVILAHPDSIYLFQNPSLIRQNRDLYALHSPSLFNGETREYDRSLEGFDPQSYWSDRDVHDMTLKRGVNYGRIQLKRWRECELNLELGNLSMDELVCEVEQFGYVADPTWDGREFVRLLEACKQRSRRSRNINEAGGQG